MDIRNQNINLMYSNHFNQNFNQNLNQNQFMLNNSNQFNMMQNINPMNNFNFNQQNLMMQNMNPMNIFDLNQQNLMIQNMNPMNIFDLNQQNLIMQNMNPANNFDLNQQNLIEQQLNNQMNFNNNNNNDINIPINQINLINSIIYYYKENNNENMDYNNPNQIRNILNLLNPNYPGLKYKEINKIDDPLYYIKVPKTTIKFVNSDYLIYKVKIPKTITKFDLYSIGKLYKSNTLSDSDVLLIYKNNVLAKDESSIEFISDEDEIRIIEPRNYPDDSFFNLLTEKNEKKMNVIFHAQTGQKSNLILPESTLISDMIKAYKLKFGLENNFTYLIYNNDILNDKDYRKIISVIKNGDKILVNFSTNPPYLIGKSVAIHISYIKTKKNLEHWFFEIGLLNSIKIIINKVEFFHKAKVKNLFIGDKKLTRDDERCLSEIGINKNFECLVEFEEIK